jgi:hypothetical protein
VSTINITPRDDISWTVSYVTEKEQKGIGANKSKEEVRERTKRNRASGIEPVDYFQRSTDKRDSGSVSSN